MNSKPLKIDEAVDFIVERQKALGDGEELRSAVISLGMTAEQAEDLIGTVRDAYSRFVLMSAGMKAQQFQGDYDSNPIFQTALKRFLATSPATTSESTPIALDQGRLSPLAWVGIALGGAILLGGAIMFFVRAIQFFRGL